MTPQRQMVWDVLRRSRRHLSAEEICAEIQETLPSFNLTSVYRTLSVLESLQLAKQTVRADGRNYWEVPHGPEHHHLVCRVCGTITHHDDPLLADVKRHLVLRHDFQPEALDLIVTGVCGHCAAGTKCPPA
jgi:Fur family ferric uptake transcriptional regulator